MMNVVVVVKTPDKCTVSKEATIIREDDYNED
jgi:hypothetical protein